MKTTGHFISMPRETNEAEVIAALRHIGVQGVQVRFTWKELEPFPGCYNFSRIKQIAGICGDHDKSLVAMIEDKSFGKLTDPAENLIPEWLWEFTARNTQYGWTTARWRQEIAHDLAMMAEELNTEEFPGFGGVAFQETAPGLDDEQLKLLGYSAIAYMDAELFLSRFAKFLYVNYIPQGQDYLAGIIADSECPIGGPDILPNDKGLVNRVYPLLFAGPNRQRYFSSMQYNSFRHKKPDGKFYTLEELVLWAREKLRVQTIFWNVPWVGMEGATMEQAYEVIAKWPDL